MSFIQKFIYQWQQMEVRSPHLERINKKNPTDKYLRRSAHGKQTHKQTNVGKNTGSLAEVLKKKQDGKQYCQFLLGH